MKKFDDMVARARAAPRHIVLAEGQDQRVVEGAVRAWRDGIAEITLLGPVDDLRLLTRAAGDKNDEIQVIDPQYAPEIEAYGKAFQDLRGQNNEDLSKAHQVMRDPLMFANMMVHMGKASGSVSGAVHATTDVARATLQVIGVDSRYSMVSSFFVLVMREDFHEFKGCMIFADCALIVDPDEDQLVQIASATADSAKTLFNFDPRVALLSFATRRSADHHLVDKVENATRKLRAHRPDLAVDGGLQFDASIVPAVGEQKAPGSSVAGRANVLIFPDLNSGNIGYKIAERIGRAEAIGPILQGLKKPANDLSRGCDANAVYNMIAVTVAQAHAADA